MRVVSKSRISNDVNSALDATIKDLNLELKNIGGVMTKLECDISAGPSGASVVITAVVNGDEPRRKDVVGVNERGVSREHSIKKATETLNDILKNKRGDIVDIFTSTVVTPLPGRVYTTIIAAINETAVETVQDADVRRQRIKKILELLNNDPSAINIARVAEVFEVSRSIIYKDLETLGFARVSEEK